MTRRFVLGILACSLALAIPGLAPGGVILSAPQTAYSIRPGEAIEINLYIKADPATEFNFYDLTFQISGGTTPVAFASPGSGDTLFDPNHTDSYIFNGRSVAGGYPGEILDTSRYGPGTKIELIDFTNDFSDVTIDNDHGLLLAALYLKAADVPAPLGETLTLSLTDADLENQGSLASIYDKGDFTPITVNVTSAVPEPGTLVLGLSAAFAFLLYLRLVPSQGRRRGSHHPRPAEPLAD